ncbi:MAG: 2-oxoacid:acceptor oxidoreductase family protein [Planctomycetota bacterium]|nr:2-oxoacid:acceptor oxidoreductase family protein [Planctomycetota bacterium]
MSLHQVKFSGFGGQGIILSGFIVGRAAVIYDKKNAAFTQSYGPEARGGYCSAEVIISDETIEYPFVMEADVLVTLSQEAFKKYASILKKDGALIYDPDMVKLSKLPETVRVYPIQATKIAEELGNKVVANVVMLGFFTAISGEVSEEAMRRSVLDSVPKKFVDLNTRAFNRGLELGKALLKKC